MFLVWALKSESLQPHYNTIILITTKSNDHSHSCNTDERVNAGSNTHTRNDNSNRCNAKKKSSCFREGAEHELARRLRELQLEVEARLLLVVGRDLPRACT